MSNTQKVEIVDLLKQKFQNSSGIYLTRYTGMNVSQATDLRSQFRENNVSFIVSKNTLTKIAAKEAGYKDDLDGILNGQIAIAYSEGDPTAPARVIKNFKKENKDESLEVVGLIFEGELFSAEKYNELADLPSKEVLLGKLVGGLSHPMTKLVGTLNGAMSKLVGTFISLKETKQ